MREASQQTDENDERIRLAGSLLHTLRGYTVAPWREEQLTDKYGEVWASASNLEMVCPKCKEVDCLCENAPEPIRVPRLFATERALLDEIRAQVGRGRKSVVFVDQTRTRDIVTTRLVPLVHNAGFRALFCDVDANKRASWIEKNSHKCDVMFVNPKAVETGLNLVQFATAIFYEIPYSLYVFKQAAARPRRPTQTQKVEIIYINPENTIAEQALSLMFEKLAAEAVFSGDNAENILNNELSSGSFMSELIKRVTDNAEVDNLEQMFTKYNKLEAENDGYFKDYDLSSYESVETISRQKTIIMEGPLEGVQLSLFGI
jgi:phage FluMu protein Com